jgi:tetratricopeptide (TPR) repeat protein
MQPANHHIYQRIILSSALVLLLCCFTPVGAHIEKGSMPDSVAEMEFRILLEFEPENMEVRNQLGMVLYRLGKLDEAEKEFYYVLEKMPENFDAIDALGLVHMQRANYQLAIDLFKKAITINPDDLLAYFHLGQAIERLGDITGAAEAYKTGLSREVTSIDKQTNAEQRQVLLDALKNIHDKAVEAEDNNT